MRSGLRVHVVGALVGLALLAGTTGVPDSPVADAAMRGDADLVRTLIDKGADVNAAQGDGMTALHWAAERGDLETTNLLLHAGANVEAGTRIGKYVPLHLASGAGRVAVVKALLDAGSDVDAATTTTGVQPIHLAAESGSPEVIRILLASGADVNAREESWGYTPLVFAASQNRADAIRTLLQLGADPSIHSHTVDVAQRAAVDRAAKKRLEEVLQRFREHEAEQGQDWTPSPEQVEAAVRAARMVQQNGVVEQESGQAGGNDVGGWGGLNPLLHAVRAGHAEAALALLEGGADINAVSKGDGTSALLISTINGYFDLAMMLLERGADPNLASDARATPLYAVINLQWAPKSRYAQPRAHEFQKTTYLTIMEALLQAGADPDVRLTKDLWYKWSGRNALGATPFWRASYGTDAAAMRLLVRYGADPSLPTKKPQGGRGYRDNDNNDDEKDKPDPSGLPPVPAGGPSTYPIHAASGVGYGENYSEGNVHRHAPDGWVPAVKYLVDELGADINARDENGYGALHHAAARGDIDLILYLVSKGADVTVLSRKGQTTADMANSPGQRLPRFPEAIALLESLGSKNNQKCYVC